MDEQEALKAFQDEHRKWLSVQEATREEVLNDLKDLVGMATLENASPEVLAMIGGATLYLLAGKP